MSAGHSFGLETFWAAFPYAETEGEETECIERLEAAAGALPDSDKPPFFDLLELQWTAHVEQLAIMEANDVGDKAERHRRMAQASARLEFCLGLREPTGIASGRDKVRLSSVLSEAALQAIDMATGSSYGSLAKSFAKFGPPRALVRSHPKWCSGKLRSFLDSDGENPPKDG